MAGEAAPTLTRVDVLAMLPAVVSDLKHHGDPLRRVKTNENIRRDLYRNAILRMNQQDVFGVEEPLPDGRHGMFIKGYVRDVWAYLEDAYDLIHGIDFERDHGDVLGRN